METLTNQEFLYRENPVDYDGTGTITRIKGNTVKFNQLAKCGRSGITIGNVVITKLDFGYNYNGQASTIISRAFDDDVDRPNIINGHKYYIKGLSGGSTSTYCMYLLSTTITNPVIYSATSDINLADFGMRIYNGYQINLNVFPQIFDLTAMGIDNLTTVEQVETWLSNNIGLLPYYDYTLGDLISFKGTGLKTVGFNQWDEEWEQGILSWTGANSSSSSARIRSKNYISVIPNTTYYAKTPTINGALQIFYYDENKQFISYEKSSITNGTFQTPNNACFMRFYTYNDGYGATYNHDICINISNPEKNGTYEPYIESTLSLEALNTLFPTGMKSAGSAYDEATSNRADTRIGEVDLGSLKIAYESQGLAYPRFRVTMPSNYKRPISGQEQMWYNLACAIYTPNGSPIAGTGVDMTMSGYYNTNNIYIYNFSYTSVSDFQQAMSGQYLYYELATPTSQDISIDLTYTVWNGGTEQILPVNDSTPVTSPIIADIDYRGLIPVNAEDDPDGSGIITGTGEYRYHSVATLTATPTDEIYRFLRWEDENGDTVSTSDIYSFIVGE